MAIIITFKDQPLIKQYVTKCVKRFVSGDFHVCYKDNGDSSINVHWEEGTLIFILSINAERIFMMVGEIFDTVDVGVSHAALQKNRKGEIQLVKGNARIIEDEFDKIFKLWTLNLIPGM